MVLRCDRLGRRKRHRQRLERPSEPAEQRNPRRKKPNDYGTGIPYHEVEALARVLLPEIQAFFESEEGQKEFAEWKEQQYDKTLK